MSAFNTSLLGLNAANSAIANNAKNIANAYTIGYKAGMEYFSSQVTGDGGAASFSSGGVRTIGVQQINQQGDLRQTNNSTDLAISGNGFMVVSSNNLGTPEYSYTRAGAFTQDVNGYLVNAAGFNLMGNQVDQYGNILPGTNTSELSSLIRINVSDVSGFSSPTSQLTIAANLPSQLTGDNGLPINTPGSTNGMLTITSPIIDSLGDSFDMVTTYTRTAVDTYTVSITCPGAATITKNNAAGAPFSGTTSMVIKFDGNGNPVSFDGNNTPPSIYIAWDPSTSVAKPNTIALNLGAVGTSTGLTCKGGGFNQIVNKNDGQQYGNFREVSIDESGIVSAIFDNGTSLPIFRIAMANFTAPNQLQSKTGDIWTQTTGSGQPVLAAAKSSGFGAFASGSLEESTTDLAKELTTLIQNQQYYTANSKAIQTDIDAFNSLLQLHP